MDVDARAYGIQPTRLVVRSMDRTKKTLGSAKEFLIGWYTWKAKHALCE